MPKSPFRAIHLKIPALLVAAGLIVAGCMGPKFDEPLADPEWDTSYPSALSPHTQLALGVMKVMQEEPSRIEGKTRLARQWQELAAGIESKAQGARINRLRREIEASLGSDLVREIRGEHYRRSDLMSFMLSTGMSIPEGGPGAIDPDLIAAKQAALRLSGEGEAVGADGYAYKSVAPGQTLSPVERLTLGTVKLLAEDRGSFEMEQVFRLALYFRPLRRIYDPSPDLMKTMDQESGETIYMDRIWRVLKPEQVRKIREMELTRSDLDHYLREHARLPGLDPEEAGRVFTLLEYAVNDFHGQIAPQTTIAPEDKAPFSIPERLKQVSGRQPGDGRELYEGICASCHGVNGQGRFPPITTQSYLKLHSDHEHAAIVMHGPPQKPGSKVVMPTFGKYLTDRQIWAVVKYIRSFEEKNLAGRFSRPGEEKAKAAGVRFYDTPEVLRLWKSRDESQRFFLDLQSDIAFRIMGHIPGSTHIRPSELSDSLDKLPADREIIVIDMFGSQGAKKAAMLAEAGYRVGYMAPGMMDWHIVRNFPVTYN